MENLNNIDDQEKAKFFKSVCSRFGWTSNTPFNEATLRMASGRTLDIYPIEDIERMYNEIALVFANDEVMSPCQISVFYQLDQSGYLQAMASYEQYLNNKNKE